MKKIIFILVFVFGFNLLQAQDFTGIKNQKPFVFSGSIRAGTSFYTAQNRYAYRSPFSYIISGSPTISIYGIRFPFRFSFRDNKFDFSKPYNRFSLNPRYKWIKLHLGHCSMRFSPYSLAGHTFWGVGVDLNPKKFRFSAMYGNLENLQFQTDTVIVGDELLKPYKRKAFAVKLGFGTSSSYFDLNVFRAEDDPGSVQNYPGYKPARNTIFGISTRLDLLWKISFSGNISASFITGDINAQKLESLINISNKLLIKLISITGSNLSSRANLAGDAELSMKLKLFSLGLRYKRIDPLYNSLGAYYFYNDFENYTINSSIKLFKSKIRLKGSYGVQRNNLSNLRSISNFRTIGSANIFLHLSKYFNLTGTYSNYQTQQRDGFVVLEDTLRMAQINERFSISPGIIFGDKKIKHSIRLTGTYQKLNYVNNPAGDNSNNIKGLYLNYNFKHKESKTNLKFGANYNETTYNNRDNVRYGITLGAKKDFFDKKLNLRLTTTWNKNISNAQSDGNILSLRLNSNYKLNKKQRMTFNLSWVNKSTIIQKPYSELRGRLSYSLSF